tara:strand:+ start:42 stop:551 length:510 start_codon:yes stop_codon:yes gene_type:complete
MSNNADFTFQVLNEDWSELKEETIITSKSWTGNDFPEEYKSQLPWFNEILWDDELHEYEGYYFRVIRMSWGVWNGYIYIPKSHTLFNKDYKDNPEIEELSVHGGITYTASHDDEVYVFGFDTYHIHDFAPDRKCRSFEEFERGIKNYKNHEYAVKEAKHLIDDIRKKYP